MASTTAQPAPPADAAAVAAATLLTAANAAGDYVETVGLVAEFVTQAVGPVEALARTDGRAVTLQPVRPSPQADPHALHAAALATMLAPGGFHAAGGTFGIRPLEVADSRPSDVLVGTLAPGRRGEASLALAVAVLTAAKRVRSDATAERPADTLVDFCDAVFAADNRSQLFASLAERVQHVAGAAAVVCLSCRPGGSRVEAVRGVDGVALDDACGAAADEVRGIGRTVCWPATTVLDRPGRRAIQRACETLCPAADEPRLTAVPLYRDDGGAVAVLLVAGPEAEESLGDHLSPTLGSAIETRLKSLRSPWRAACDAIGEAVRTRAVTLGLVAAVALALGLCIPLPYRSACECVLSPGERRFVAAPFDGAIREAAVRPGDLVEVGDTLAILDEKEIEWERAGLRAEMAEAAKRRDASLALGELSAAQEAGFELERLTARDDLLRDRSGRLIVRAPIAGLVVSGDLDGATGIPVETGQTLFEIAPLDTLTAEVLVPEFDYARVAAGQPADVRLDALPGWTLAGVVDRIRPRAESRDGEVVFVAEVRLDNRLQNQTGPLRPGMTGEGSITTPRAPLALNLWHRAAGRWGRGW